MNYAVSSVFLSSDLVTLDMEWIFIDWKCFIINNYYQKIIRGIIYVYIWLCNYHLNIYIFTKYLT